MARYIGPKVRLRQKFGLAGPEASIRRKNVRPRKKSDYGVRLEQKQKLKFIYGVMERQMSRYAAEAFKSQRDPQAELMQRLEARLDNVVFRLGLAKTREAARQLVNHGHIRVDGKKLDIPSYKVVAGQVIALAPKMAKSQKFMENVAAIRKDLVTLGHLEYEKDGGRFLAAPALKDLPKEVDISQVLEYYHQTL